MSENVPRPPDRKPARHARPRPGSKPFAYDRHGDIVVEYLDDGCGATVADLDPMAMRWLARSPVEAR